MTPDRRQACDRLVADVRRIFGPRLRSCTAYGEVSTNGDPLTTLVLVDSLTADDLSACAALTAQWRRSGLAIPLIVPTAEFRASVDAFPLEYDTIRATHVLLAGAPPFDGVTIVPEDVRRACEVQVKSHLLHLRQGYLEAGGNMTAVSRLVSASAPALFALLQNLARLEGVSASTPAELARDAAARLGVPAGLVGDVLALAHKTAVPTVDPARLFPSYLEMMEVLAHRVDQWRG